MNPIHRLSRAARSLLHLNRPREVAVLTRMIALSSEHRLLDVGCGDGYLTARFGKRAREVVGLDPDPKMIGMARTLHAGPNLQFDQGIAEKLPYPDASFDRVVAVSVAEHFQDPAAGLKEMARVLRPGGVLAISVDSLLPANSSEQFRSWHTKRYYVTTYFRVDELVQMLRAGGLTPDTDGIMGIHMSQWDGSVRRVYMRHKAYYFPLFPVFLELCRLSDLLGLGGRMPPQILTVRAQKRQGGQA
jgi:SAM-dependent methyltransferase